MQKSAIIHKLIETRILTDIRLRLIVAVQMLQFQSLLKVIKMQVLC